MKGSGPALNGDGMMKAQLIFGTLIAIFLASILSPSLIAGAISDGISSGMSTGTADAHVSAWPTVPAIAATRQQAEERILQSTVRIYIETWIVKPDESGYEVDSASSHATLKDGRFLVTHNHFSVPLAGDSELDYAAVTLANSDGQALFSGPLSDFELVWEDPETLVIAHKDVELFENLGFVSAEFKDWSSVPLEPGMEVAQVDWDGTTTRVDWTTVKEINVDDGIPRLVLADGITLGASGGGIFWQGHHIANNWLLVQELGASDELLGTTTKAALNSVQVTSRPGQALASG
jgi:hypothetical protein